MAMDYAFSDFVLSDLEREVFTKALAGLEEALPFLSDQQIRSLASELKRWEVRASTDTHLTNLQAVQDRLIVETVRDFLEIDGISEICWNAVKIY